ncbi:hypothetical protein BD414DRAFT_426364 [Trametes punicea]|nr:hypothetical protein BD414DRAFT_426364 [Trametes punicea]
MYTSQSNEKRFHENLSTLPYAVSPPSYSASSASSSQALAPPTRVASFAPTPYGDLNVPLPGDNPKGFKEHLKNFAPGKSPAKLLDPPPRSFTRNPPPDLPYGAFPVMEVICKGSTLDNGFPYIAPMCSVLPHPFVDHDVNEHDWRWFLHDVRIAGSLSPMNRVLSGVIPIVFPLGFVIGLAATIGTDSYVRRKKQGPVSELIEHWNNHFFHPRSIHIALSKGPLMDGQIPQRRSKPTDKKWRLVISYRPAILPQ